MKFVLTGAFLLAAIVAGCSSAPSAGASPSATQSTVQAPAPRPPSRESSGNFVLLDFEEDNPFQATAEGSVVEVSDQRLGIRIGRVTSGDGSRGLRFPRYGSTADAPRMVLVVRPRKAATTSARPPRGGFSFGADVKLDRDARTGRFDNGDNVVQRGLFADASQYKLQVDRRVPSCTVKSPTARSFVKLAEPMERGWYRVACEYRDGMLTVTASRMQAGQIGLPDRASVLQDVGALSFKPTTPLVIGGKIGSNGRLVKNQPDQFNGVLDNVYVTPGL